MKKLFIAVMLPAMLALSGCSRQEDKVQYDRAVNVTQSQEPGPERFIVKRVQVVVDSLAYDGQRGVYILLDTQTNKEYVGVSGVGISELGSHQSGKTTYRDER